ncbi:MAG: 4-hydroxybenzoate octaprenyltransferase, partial [Sphingobacteriia bacterium]
IGFDREKGLHSIPAWLGAARALRVSRVLHVLSALCIVVAGWAGPFHVLYALGAAVFVGLLVFQQSLVKPTDLSRVNLAFMTANGIASVVFGLLVGADLCWQVIFSSSL